MRRQFLFTWLGALALCARATAQLELPENKVPPPAGKPVELPGGSRGDLAEKVGGKKREKDAKPAVGPHSQNPLVLPDGAAAQPAPAPVKAGPEAGAPIGPAANAATPVGPAAAPALSSTSAADFVLTEVAKLHDVGNEMVDHAAQSLLRMGEVGRTAAVRALSSDHAPTVMVGAKTLLQTGNASDCELVQERLRTKLPPGACTPLVDALAALDPVHASPTFLAELLSHRQTAVRTAVQRHLSKSVGDLPASALVVPAQSKDSDARLRAVQLLASTRDPAALPMLMEHLDDSNPQVARRVVDALAGRDEATLDADLLRRAFDGRWVLRAQAYALLAICEREDSRLSPQLSEAHAQRLLEGLNASDTFVAGTCAAALAGIGFRTSDAESTKWLDLEVPHRLVRAVAAEDFSSDFSALVPTAQRRLTMITGESYGSDGPQWIAWWGEHARTFHASRAALAVQPEEAGSIALSVISNTSRAEAFTLLGPERAMEAAHASELQGETYYLSDRQARALVEELRSGGLFGTERLPGARGSPLDAGRSLTVSVRDRSKSFRFAGDGGEPWFLAAIEAARALRERNLWQRYRDPNTYPTQLELWQAESSWWDQATDERERDRKLWTMVLARAGSLAPSERDSCVDELARLARERDLVESLDFQPLVQVIKSEHFLGARVHTLVALALESASKAADPGAPLAPAFADDLIAALIQGFEAKSAEEIAAVMQAAGREYARKRAGDELPFVRAVAAATLSRHPAPEDLEVLRKLLADPIPQVEAAAVLALGEGKVEEARTEILLRARMGSPDVRPNALLAAGMLGGDGALNVLLKAITDDRDPRVPPAGARGLALLHDPGTVPVLVSLLTKGADDPCYAPAREGLIELGPAACDELLRVVHSPSNKARREAALILSEQLAPQVASVLMTLYSDQPDDARIAEELTVLTCEDFRREPSPPVAWWNWWEYVVHDDAQAWLVGAVGRLGLDVPSAADVRAGTPEALSFLGALLQRDETYLAERARRELERLLGRPTGAMPARGRQRQVWFNALVESLNGARAVK